MKESLLLDVGRLRVGLHVKLDLGWMSHPFPLNSFRLSSQEQIDTLRGLGLARVTVLLPVSEMAALRALVDDGLLDAVDSGLTPLPTAAAPLAAVAAEPTPEQLQAQAARDALAAERRCAVRAERAYNDAGRVLKRCFELAPQQPTVAREQCEAQVHVLLDKLLAAEEMSIRLLSETAGDRGSLHAVNVAVLSLLLGQQMGLPKTEMFDLGVGALLHDIGKIELPDRIRWLDPLSPHVTHAERQVYQDHVAHGVTIGRRMDLSAGALLVLAQHHEHSDGSGFPKQSKSGPSTDSARIVALVNRYDNLCNPASPVDALTPHEALSLMYGQMRSKFDAAAFGAFIKMLGIYPPGSVVQLTDERYAMVVAVNAARPLKPRVRVHEPKVDRQDAMPLDLEQAPGLGIRRSLKPQHLPRAVLDDLSPRQRICYFFERARETSLMALAA